MSSLRRHIMMQHGGGRILTLQSVNGAYINTLSKVAEDSEFEITFLVPTTIPNGWVYGEWAGTNGDNTSFGAAINVVRFGTSYKLFPAYLNDGNLHTLNVTKDRFILDWQIIYSGSGVFVPRVGNYYIALYKSSTGSSLDAQPFCIASAKHWKSGVLVQELLPHYDGTFGEWGFLDSVSGNFFRRATTGRFDPVYI